MAKPKSKKGSVSSVITVILLIILSAGSAYVGAVLAAAGVLAAFNLRLLFIIACTVVLFFLLCAATKIRFINVFAIVLELVLMAGVAGGYFLFTQADVAIAKITAPADVPASEQMVTSQVNVLVPQGTVSSFDQLSGYEIGYSSECSETQLESIRTVLADVPGVSMRLIGGGYDTYSALMNGEIGAAVIPTGYYLILTEEVFTDSSANPTVLATVEVTESLESATAHIIAADPAASSAQPAEEESVLQPEEVSGTSEEISGLPAEPETAQESGLQAKDDEPVVEPGFPEEPVIQTEVSQNAQESAVETQPVVSEFTSELNIEAYPVDEPYESSTATAVDGVSAEAKESFTDVTLNVEELTEEQLSEILASNSEDTFIVYFSGIDSYGDISTVSRSDVNILAAINFNTHKIQLVSTPRDYYLPISVSEGGLNDKLTHCGLYGIRCSMDTLSAAYGINIDYYVRLNFSGFIDIVNALGGIDVYNESSFTQNEYEYPEGMLHLEDTAALYFARHRRTIGDSNRGGNHMKIIAAIIDKVCSSPEILLNYNKLLSGVANSFQTDFTPELIYTLVSKQIADGRGWEMESYTVGGYGSESTETYSMWSTPVYVLVPNYDTVTEARELLEAVING